MSEKEKMPFCWKVIQDTGGGPVVWGTFNNEEELLKFMKYMTKNCRNDALADSFRVREIYLEYVDNNFMAYAAFLGLGDRKEVKEN